MDKPGAFLKEIDVFVTGGTGFVGLVLCKRLLNLGARLHVLVRKGRKADAVRELENLGAIIHIGDVTDYQTVVDAMQGCRYVFHIAALFREAKHDDDVYRQVNVQGVENVLNAAEALAVQRVVHCSTVGVHSHIPNPPANEEEPYRPGDIYQSTKCEGEKLALERFTSGRVKGVVIRPAMIWGEGDRRLLKLFKNVAKRRFPVIGSGKTLTHWIYVHDLVDGFLLAAEKTEALGQVYIIAGEHPVSISELVEAVAECAGVKPFPFKIPAAPVQIAGSLCEAVCVPLGIEPPLYRRRVDFFTKDRCFDVSKAKKELGFAPSIGFKNEVKNIYNWYKEQGWL